MLVDEIAPFIAHSASRAYAYGQAIFGPTAMMVLSLAFGIACYAILVGTFYTLLSRRVLYHLDLRDHLGGEIRGWKKASKIASFVLSYTLVFPLITFLWFVALSVLLYVLSRTLSLASVFMLSLSVVASIRVCAYYKEEIAVDVAKLLPLALLGVLLVDPTYFNESMVRFRLLELFRSLPQFIPYLGIAIGIEWLLRILLACKRAVLGHKETNTR